MTGLEETAEGIAPGGADLDRLEQALVEACYLGLSLRALAANPEFRFAEVTSAASEPLLGWAKFIDERLRAGERPFAPERAPSAPTRARRR